MQSNAETNGSGSSTIKHGAQFIGVRDSRNRRVAGIYNRNGRFYAQLWVSREDGAKTARKFPLLTQEGAAVANLAEAKEAADVLRNDRREKALPTSGHKPKFADYVETYFAKPNVTAKKPGTLENERQALNRWKAHLGDARIDRIEASDIAALRDKRLRAGAKPRTVNLDIIAIRNVLKAAIEDEYMLATPQKGLAPNHRHREQALRHERCHRRIQQTRRCRRVRGKLVKPIRLALCEANEWRNYSGSVPSRQNRPGFA